MVMFYEFADPVSYWSDHIYSALRMYSEQFQTLIIWPAETASFSLSVLFLLGYLARLN